ncbi:hypothetical protein CDD83_11192 [Cordyceps sp. RAO-2017]|nr:hypothetical protein CDD83_11192 [Cordyceps sp. RAO-2017]
MQAGRLLLLLLLLESQARAEDGDDKGRRPDSERVLRRVLEPAGLGLACCPGARPPAAAQGWPQAAWPGWQWDAVGGQPCPADRPQRGARAPPPARTPSITDDISPSTNKLRLENINSPLPASPASASPPPPPPPPLPLLSPRLSSNPLSLSRRDTQQAARASRPSLCRLFLTPPLSVVDVQKLVLVALPPRPRRSR